MGIIESIHIAPEHEGVPVPIQQARVLPGRGLAGDRYAAPDPEDTGWEFSTITLIEAEVVESAALAPGESRRNITVRGAALNPLIGQQFRVGAVLCEGVELCHPCASLEKSTGRPGLVKQLAGRGGIRARVLEEGAIHVGDTITVVE